jgi:small subunit ribosomal protein S4
VNGHKVDISSYTCGAGDIVEVRERPSSRQIATRGLEGNQFRTPPPWLTLQSDTLRGTVSRLPSPEEMQPGVNVQLIVEFYSR